jgi:hypothetical protein
MLISKQESLQKRKVILFTETHQNDYMVNAALNLLPDKNPSEDYVKYQKLSELPSEYLLVEKTIIFSVKYFFTYNIKNDFFLR